MPARQEAAACGGPMPCSCVVGCTTTKWKIKGREVINTHLIVVLGIFQMIAVGDFCVVTFLGEFEMLQLKSWNSDI